VSYHGVFYHLGGRQWNQGPILDVFWSYDAQLNEWTVLKPMPTARAGLAAAALKGSIYAIGGRTGLLPNTGTKLHVVERYDLHKKTWTTVASLTSARSDLAAAVVGHRIFVFGGFDANSEAVSTVEVYLPHQNKWSGGLKPMPTRRATFNYVVPLRGLVYVIGGFDESFVTLATVEAYDVVHDMWEEGLPSMPTRRASAGSVRYGNKIFVLGGTTGNGIGGDPVAANEVYVPQWSWPPTHGGSSAKPVREHNRTTTKDTA